jgi:hypothetical protein
LEEFKWGVAFDISGFNRKYAGDDSAEEREDDFP